MDPLTLGVLGMLGFTAYSAVQSGKTPKIHTPSAPPTPAQGGLTPEDKKTRKYRPAAQLFRDEDLRLGVAGRLGAVG